MAKINVYILASHRSRCIEIQAHFFMKMKNKDKIKVYFLTTGHECYGWDTEPIYHEWAKKLNDAGVETVINVTNGGGNYMQKIHFAQTQECEYAVSLDEDLWFNENVWDYMVDNCHLLDDPQNLVLSPILSNGIPTCDMFCKDFMNDADRAEVFNMMVETHIPNMWGANYSHLNQATRYAGGIWNPDRYYQLAAEINHHYKGIHPVRIHFDLNKRINDIILANWPKLVNVPYDQLRAEPSTYPYLCNSVFMIKAETWGKIIANKSLFRDDYDEVPLNIYRENHGLRWLFIRNGFCLHMIYNTVGQNDYERDFTTRCLDLIRAS